MEPIRLERHRQGPRVYLFGRRTHECHLGLAVFAAALLGRAAGLWPSGAGFWIAVGAGGALTLKDWRDLVPSLRDTGTWRLGPHRRFAPLRAIRYADGLPNLAGWLAFAIGVANFVSALTPNIAWRGHLLLRVMPVRALPLFHSLAVPAAAVLVVSSVYLRRRRRRAWRAAFSLLVALGALNLLKGFDVEEAALSWAGAATLWWARDAFYVRHARVGRRSPLAAFGLLVALVGAVGATVVWLGSGREDEPLRVLRETLDLFFWNGGRAPFRDEFAQLPLALGALTIAAIVVGSYLLFRPLPPPREPACGEERETAEELVRSHGSDTLAFFKLRRDMQYLFDPEERAFLGYRIEGSVMLVAGDPVGPADAMRDVVREAVAFAEVHGLAIAALGAGEWMLPLWRDAGLRSLYIGDEAIVETARFSLEGRAIRKVRQSVTRLEKAGYRSQLRPLDDLDDATVDELERISALWRGGGPERGFSMAMDSLASGGDSLVVLARDRDGRVRGFLHFVPAYGRAAVSLSYMRRDRETPNGLTEFLVVSAIELLRARGVDELSLNFAAFGRLLERPGGRFERLLGRLVTLGSRYFQMESLYRFNAKFSPRWEPRYFVFEGLLSFPRAGLAALWAEGQLPRLPIGHR
ncbi:MAG TPA: phosphatidylglycerol lysyltransferase domain-containing protein [Gaiellaceae bacterium]|nr:phosphatidylglycerol lysyltransferase domain-containing protein [Gaiellaceae bacterium]